ncbi:MAG TPA: transglycosylase SLT domain-containing protein [Bacillota bacterium]|nr:transglycosylase SLT domain-containing protein [Bacillota bacterium]
MGFRYLKVSSTLMLVVVALILFTSPAMAPCWARPQLSGEKTTEHPWAQPIAFFIHQYNPHMSQNEVDEIVKAVMASSEEYKLDPRLMIALIAVESGFERRAVSSRGARGLTQITPDKCQEQDWTNVYHNVSKGTAYLKEQIKAFPSVSMALAAYNAGPGRARMGPQYYPRETRLYIKKVLSIYESLLQTTSTS